MFSLHTQAASPYTVLFASCTASGGVRKLIATSTGPKISACATAAELDAPVISVGGNHEPLAGSSHADWYTVQPSARADVDRLVERRAEGQLVHARAQLGEEFFLDRFLHQQTRTGAADLALVEPDRIDQAFDGGVEVRVFEDDERRFAAQFQRQLLAAAGGGDADQATDFGRAGEGQLVDTRMVDDRFADAAIAGDDVDDAGRYAGLHADFGEQHRRQRGEFGRLEDDRVTGGQRRGDFPGQHQQREIPRHDLADHADGAVVGEFFGLQLCPAGVVVEVARRQRHVDVARFTDGLAVVQRLQHSEQTRMLLQQARQRVQHARASVAAQCLPARLRATGRFDGAVDVVAGRLRQVGQLRCVGRIGRGEQFARRAPRVVDEQAEGAGVLLQPGLRFFLTFGCWAVVHGVEDLFNCWHDVSVFYG